MKSRHESVMSLAIEFLRIEKTRLYMSHLSLEIKIAKNKAASQETLPSLCQDHDLCRLLCKVEKVALRDEENRGLSPNQP